MKKMYLSFLIITFILAGSIVSFAQQNRGVGIKTISQLPPKEKRWALIIGVDNFGLEGAVNDARALKDTLSKHAGFPPDQITLLTSDAADSGKLPTRGNIIESLDKLIQSVDKDGLFLFAFAGHGKTVDNNAYLIPSDGRMTDNYKLLKELSIDVLRIKEAVAEIKKINQ